MTFPTNSELIKGIRHNDSWVEFCIDTTSLELDHLLGKHSATAGAFITACLDGSLSAAGLSQIKKRRKELDSRQKPDTVIRLHLLLKTFLVSQNNFGSGHRIKIDEPVG